MRGSGGPGGLGPGYDGGGSEGVAGEVEDCKGPVPPLPLPPPPTRAVYSHDMIDWARTLGLSFGGEKRSIVVVLGFVERNHRIRV